MELALRGQPSVRFQPRRRPSLPCHWGDFHHGGTRVTSNTGGLFPYPGSVSHPTTPMVRRARDHAWNNRGSQHHSGPHSGHSHASHGGGSHHQSAHTHVRTEQIDPAEAMRELDEDRVPDEYEPAEDGNGDEDSAWEGN
eukprot:3260943-Pyramimonas_sp.AAC.1